MKQVSSALFSAIDSINTAYSDGISAGKQLAGSSEGRREGNAVLLVAREIAFASGRIYGRESGEKQWRYRQLASDVIEKSKSLL